MPGVVNFEHISHLALVFVLLTLNMKLPAGDIAVFLLGKNCTFETLLLI